jgi:putative FmdB family regulatory protein
MPIYEYRCDACGHEDEIIQKISDDPITVCPECGAEAFKKLISAAGFRLKGGGWYETDFKSGNKKNLHGEKESGTKPDKKEGKDSKASKEKAPAAGASKEAPGKKAPKADAK